MEKKGAISLNDAPYVVMVVGFIFLLMATIAYVSEEYREGMGATLSGTVTNETGFYLNGTTFTISEATLCNFENFVVTTVHNASDGAVITSGNYTVGSTDGTFVNASSDWDSSFEVNLTYTYDYGGTACNVTESLETELDDNTSIAGVVLTISLVAIVLSILIGVFMGVRRRI